MVVRIELFGSNRMILKPIKSARSYYDEFIIISSRFELRFNLMVGVVLTMCLLVWAYFIIKDYLFGDIKTY